MPAASSQTQPDFIEVYDNALDPGACRALIERFEASGFAQRGETGGGVDISVKDSWDIPLQEYPSWSDAQQMLNDAVLVGFKRYLRRYPHLALATSRLQVPRSDGGAPVMLDADRLAQADDERSEEHTSELQSLTNLVCRLLFVPRAHPRPNLLPYTTLFRSQEYPSWSDAQQMLNDAVLVGFKRYLRRYPHLALATSRLQVPRSDGGAPVMLDADRLAQADDE